MVLGHELAHVARRRASGAGLKHRPAAQQAHDTVQALVGFGRLSLRSGQEDLAAALGRIQVTQDQQRVTVTVDLPQEMAARLLKTFR